MKKPVLLLGALIAVALIATVCYKLSNQTPSADLTSDQQAIAIFNDGGCIACHSQEPELPFYSDFPVIGDMVKTDAEIGYKHFDMSATTGEIESGKGIGVVALAKIEKVFAEGSMPKSKYYLIHWGSATTDAKKEIVLDWAKSHRTQHYQNGLAATQFANEPIQPIANTVDVDNRKVALGFKLFHDTRLSSDNTVSCASCHDLNGGGVDNLQFSEGVGKQLGGVNAPTVFNSSFNAVQFWDGRAETLALQAAGPPLNPIEMASTSWEEIITKLAADKALSNEFVMVYPNGFTEHSITDAIAEFEKTLITPNSDFDKYLMGNESAITAHQKLGYDLFKELSCATCHTSTTLGGQTFEAMGLKHDYFADRATEITEEDNGRYKQTKSEFDRHRFKVPTLRNVALTSPYMHDGTSLNLTDAVAVMAKYQKGHIVTNEENAAIVDFLKSLTGEYNGVKLTNPKSAQ